ncbi:Rab family GTPase [Aliikangiella coralliicola]|uniref:GTP-binding protein n=1 Tax=Aliikangiella coralliicola TaxID=2592383 RepID=A0A545UIQ4_9GAMM|nr:Rab family GTPase [Aliikangiella coralliicola]TQV89351.1 GTP-binding protein [Aliikangiella coralliicola]
MISKKICMVGAFAVGKTSLVRQFVESIFDEKYHTTIGVKIDKRQVSVKDKMVQLMLWDIEGVDVFTEFKPSYLRGASGVIIVADSTRPKTIEVAKQIKHEVELTLSNAQFLLLINKSDLAAKWQPTENDLIHLDIDSNNIFNTSAKTGSNVEKAFRRIAELVLDTQVNG